MTTEWFALWTYEYSKTGAKIGKFPVRTIFFMEGRIGIHSKFFMAKVANGITIQTIAGAICALRISIFL